MTIAMTISYSSTEAAPGPDIKRQSTNVAGTNSWMQSGGRVGL